MSMCKTVEIVKEQCVFYSTLFVTPSCALPLRLFSPRWQTRKKLNYFYFLNERMNDERHVDDVNDEMQQRYRTSWRQQHCDACNSTVKFH